MFQRTDDSGQIEGDSMATEAQKRAREKYNKETYKFTTFKLNKTTEADLIEHLEAQPNKQGYIRSLIKKDMNSGK